MQNKTDSQLLHERTRGVSGGHFFYPPCTLDCQSCKTKSRWLNDTTVHNVTKVSICRRHWQRQHHATSVCHWTQNISRSLARMQKDDRRLWHEAERRLCVATCGKGKELCQRHQPTCVWQLERVGMNVDGNGNDLWCLGEKTFPRIFTVVDCCTVLS